MLTSLISGQPLANTVSKTVSVAPITQISDAQPQAATSQPSVVTMAPVSMITDGKPGLLVKRLHTQRC